MTADLKSVYPPEIWARESLLVLERSRVVSRLIHTDFKDEVADYGDTVNTRRPSRFTVADVNNTGTGTFTWQQPVATNVQVVLDQHKVVPFTITNKDQNTSIKDLVAEFVEPASMDLADNIDDSLLGSSCLSSTSITKVSLAGSALALTDFAAMRGQLRNQLVPFEGANRQSRIHAVMGVEHEQESLVISELVTANQSGFADPPIQTGFITNVFGINLYASQGVPAGPASTDDGLTCAFHRNAATLVTRPLSSPNNEGVVSSVMEKDGVSIRVVRSFTHSGFHHRVSLDVLYGFKLLDANLAVRLADT